MADKNPFESIESAHGYVRLLVETVEESRGTIREMMTAARSAEPRGDSADRVSEALQLVSYKLEQLSNHLAATRRLLNDLRTLRRLLLSEREE